MLGPPLARSPFVPDAGEIPWRVRADRCIRDHVSRSLLGLCIVGCVGQVVHAQGLDPVAVEAFFDTAWADTLRGNGLVPGAVVTVVHDGHVVLNKGYGVRDIDTGEAVDPGNTRIRIGSVSKLFSALTALALVDEGKIDLNRNVNDYLTTVRVPDTYDEPVTLRTLLSHRSGFEAGFSGYMSHDNNDVEMEPEAYERHLIRVHPPNREYGYDNLAVGLMGHLAGEVNGTSFARAVEEKVTGPLGLGNTTMGVPDSQLEHMAACHSWDSNGEPVKCIPKFMRGGYQGAGDVTTTGADMARFMRALLNGGCVDTTCVLEGKTFNQFTDLNLNRLHPLAAGLGFIIYEKQAAGRLAMGHDGGQDGFTTSLILFPETRTGVFMSRFSNVGVPDEWGLSLVIDAATRGAQHNLYRAQAEIEARFAEAFLPERTASDPRLPDIAAETDLAFLTGTYVDSPTHGAGSMLLSRMLGLANVLDVAAIGEDVFVNGDGPFGHTGGGVLEMDGTDTKWLFTRIEHDLILQKSGALPFDMYVKKPWHWDARATVLPLIVPILLAVPALIFGFVQRRSRPAGNVGYLLAFSGFAVLTGIYLELQYFAANYFPEGPTGALIAWRVLLNLGWLAAVAALYLIIANPGQWLGVHSIASLGRFLLVALFAVSATAVAILLPYWGLVGNLWGA